MPTRKRRSKSRKIRKKQSRKNFKILNCAPDPNRKHSFSCFNTDKINIIKKAWNARHPDVKIKSKDPKKVWETLKTYMGEICNNELCWLNQQFINNDLNNDLLNYTFAPKSPKSWKKNPNEWLDSLNILGVIKQYEKKYSCFDFIGPSPIDYDTHYSDGECVWEELCEFKLQDMINKGKNKLGIIFNLDPHHKSGSHWVSMFVNVKKRTIHYFDSNGIAPPKQIKKLMNNISDQGKKLGINFILDHNTKQHQFGDTECGMYSLYFIIEMLKDRPWSDFKKKRITDKQMTNFRNIYFN